MSCTVEVSTRDDWILHLALEGVATTVITFYSSVCLQRCSLKWTIPAPVSNPSCVSGIVRSVTLYVDRAKTSGTGNTAPQGGRLPLHGDETMLSMRVLGDASVLEVFGHEGRARIASRIYPSSASNTVGIAAFYESPSSKPSRALYSVWRDHAERHGVLDFWDGKSDHQVESRGENATTIPQLGSDSLQLTQVRWLHEPIRNRKTTKTNGASSREWHGVS